MTGAPAWQGGALASKSSRAAPQGAISVDAQAGRSACQPPSKGGTYPCDVLVNARCLPLAPVQVRLAGCTGGPAGQRQQVVLKCLRAAYVGISSLHSMQSEDYLARTAAGGGLCRQLPMLPSEIC
jgi:hypothetical protein